MCAVGVCGDTRSCRGLDGVRFANDQSAGVRVGGEHRGSLSKMPTAVH